MLLRIETLNTNTTWLAHTTCLASICYMFFCPNSFTRSWRVEFCFDGIEVDVVSISSATQIFQKLNTRSSVFELSIEKIIRPLRVFEEKSNGIHSSPNYFALRASVGCREKSGGKFWKIVQKFRIFLKCTNKHSNPSSATFSFLCAYSSVFLYLFGNYYSFLHTRTPLKLKNI